MLFYNSFSSLEIIPTTNKEKRYMNIVESVNVVEIAIHRLLILKICIDRLKIRRRRCNRTIQRLQNDIEDRKNKISLIEKLHSLVNKSAGEQNNKCKNLLLRRID
jgi:hypothetical protein